MSHLIILTAAEADKVRGMSSPMAAIEPILLKDGTFMLGVEVLADPAHAKHLSVFDPLPKAEISAKKAVMFAEGEISAEQEIAEQANAQQQQAVPSPADTQSIEPLVKSDLGQ